MAVVVNSSAGSASDSRGPPASASRTSSSGLSGRRGAPRGSEPRRQRQRQQRGGQKRGRGGCETAIIAVALILVASYSVLVYRTLSSAAREGEGEGTKDEGRKSGLLPSAVANVVAGSTSRKATRLGAAPEGPVATESGRTAEAGAKPSREKAPAPAGGIQQSRRRGAATGRFPHYGTPQFSAVCNWTAAPLAHPYPGRQCSWMARPMPKSNEGLAAWAGQIVSGFVLAVQTGCALLADYGPDVNVGAVLRPQLPMEGFPLINWTVPHNYGECDGRKHCKIVSDNYKTSHTFQFARTLPQMKDRPPLVPSPKYRFLYMSTHTQSRTGEVVRDVQASLPGFQLDSGMACSFERILRLAPSAEEYSPGLFDAILPAVRDETALVIALYIRTGRTDQASKAEEEGKTLGEERGTKIGTKSLAGRAVRRAVEIEGVKLGEMDAEDMYSRVVWSIVTDSPHTKKLIAEEYNGKMAASSPNCIKAGGKEPLSIPRTVVSTTSRGVQTKPKRGPSTADWAEAFLDWYLVGESDYVISTGGISFGTTGALRTARPIVSGVDVQNCTLEIAGYS